MAAGKKPNKADKSNVKKRTVNKKASEVAKKTPAKKIPAGGLLKDVTKKTPAKTTLPMKKTAEKASPKRTPARGLLKDVAKKTPAKKATKSGNKKEALTKKISSKVKLAKMTAAAGKKKELKKTPAKKVLSLKSGNKKGVVTKKIPSKAKSVKRTAGKKKETKKTAGLKNPVIVIKSVDVSASSSTEKAKKIPKEEKEEEKEMSVEISCGQQQAAASETPAAQIEKTPVEENSSSVSTSMANIASSSSGNKFELADFVQTRLAAINSPSVGQVGIRWQNIYSHLSFDKQELSGSKKSTLADLINYNVGLAHNLYQVQEIFTSLISVLVW